MLGKLLASSYAQPEIASRYAKRHNERFLILVTDKFSLEHPQTRNYEDTPSDIAAKPSEAFNKTISARIIRRRLQEAGSKGCKARKKSWLSDKNKKALHEWALKYQNFTKQDWSNILWSAESNFEVNFWYIECDPCPSPDRSIGEKFKATWVVPIVKDAGRRVTMWGCMSASRLGQMFMCEGLIQTRSSVKFQRDNATCHKVVRTMACFQDNNIELLNWPAQSA
ncbi:hypothetical protein Trydic_g1440 [Trypoxylus dichotomus]